MEEAAHMVITNFNAQLTRQLLLGKQGSEKESKAAKVGVHYCTANICKVKVSLGY